MTGEGVKATSVQATSVLEVDVDVGEGGGEGGMEKSGEEGGHVGVEGVGGLLDESPEEMMALLEARESDLKVGERENREKKRERRRDMHTVCCVLCFVCCVLLLTQTPTFFTLLSSPLLSPKLAAEIGQGLLAENTTLLCEVDTLTTEKDRIQVNRFFLKAA